MRLIDADTIVTIQVYDDMTEEWGMEKMTVAEAIDAWSDEGCPHIVDAELVRHAHWEDKYDDGDWHCSACGAIVEKDEQNRHNWNRCYHCGAKMDGK